MNLRKDVYDIWLFRRLHTAQFSRNMGVSVYNHTGLGTLRILASTGVFVLVVCALKRSVRSGSSKPSMILIHRRNMQRRSSQKLGPSRNFTERGNEQIPPWVK